METAGDLTRLISGDRLLDRIVRRARALLDTDAAYLLLYDEASGEIFMRSCDGIHSPEFVTIRLGQGSGLAGRVVERVAAEVTSDYLNDPRFRHSEELDRVVAAEGLISLVGVPVAIDGTNLGVLFAADRYERNYTRAEVELLTTFAGQAAIGLENTRLYEQAKSALIDLDRANTELQLHLRSVERSADAHARLTALVASGGEPAHLAAAVSETFGSSALLLDPTGKVIAHGGDPADDLDVQCRDAGRLPRTPAFAALYAAIGAPHASGHAVYVASDEGYDRWVAPVKAGRTLLGSLLVRLPENITPVDQGLLERSGQTSALLLANHRSITEARRRVATELIVELFSRGKPDAFRTEQLSERLSRRLDVDLVVVVALVDAPLLDVAAAEAQALMDDMHSVVGITGEELIVLLHSSEAEEAVRTVSRVLKRSKCRVTCGAAGPASGLQELGAAYQQARTTVRALRTLGREGDAAAIGELGVYGVLAAGMHTRDLDGFIERTLGRLMSPDQRKSQELLRTLETYFDSGDHAAEAASSLFIHVNTLYQRLDRARDLTGLDWRRPEERLQLQLALRLHKLRDAAQE